MKTKVFAVRNAREILRDPLSYVFALGFPVVMLVIMTIVNGSLPFPQNYMKIHQDPTGKRFHPTLSHGFYMGFTAA